MSTHAKILAVSVVCAGALAGCTPPPRVLAQHHFTEFEKMGIKSVRVVRQLNEDGSYYDHVIRLCDVDAQGTETNCQDSLILETKVR